MAYTVHCPTRLIFSDDAGADLAREAGALPPGRALVVTDDGLMRAGLVAPLMEALRGAGRVSCRRCPSLLVHRK